MWTASSVNRRTNLARQVVRDFRGAWSVEAPPCRQRVYRPYKLPHRWRLAQGAVPFCHRSTAPWRLCWITRQVSMTEANLDPTAFRFGWLLRFGASLHRVHPNFSQNEPERGTILDTDAGGATTVETRFKIIIEKRNEVWRIVAAQNTRVSPSLF